jgi:hypothetical protein
MSLSSSHREIERKFLIREMPADLTSRPHADISQGYLVSLDDGLQVRLRKTGERYSLTYKRGMGNVREEREVELTVEQFAVLWPATEGKRLVKTLKSMSTTRSTRALSWPKWNSTGKTRLRVSSRQIGLVRMSPAIRATAINCWRPKRSTR